MTPLQELQYEAMRRLKDYQDKHPGNLIIHGAETLGQEYTRTLVNSGYLENVIKGWYIPSSPDQSGTSAAWYASYWSFISEYMTDKYQEEWCLSPELSLDLNGGNITIPKQITVRSPKASNNLIALPHGCSILDIKASLPKFMKIDTQTHARIYSPEAALFQVMPDTYRRRPTEAAVCLSLINDESPLIELATDTNSVTKIGRIAGAMRAIGKTAMADRISDMMRAFGYKVEESNPFNEPIRIPTTMQSPYSARIIMMWDKLRNEVLDIKNSVGIAPTVTSSKADILKNIEDNYVQDSYNSLSIEGYKISEELIRKVAAGDWDPKGNEGDKEIRNALVARGYYQAFQSVKESINGILDGEDAGEIYVRDHRKWHFQLFQPGVTAGIIKPKDLVGYRNHPVYIKNSKHVPVNESAVVDCMSTLDSLMEKENDPLVRAILGHFFFTYIHPYMDGNGRTARFLKNSQLASSGYGWLVIKDIDRRIYMETLETASVSMNIRPFATFISSKIKEMLSAKASANTK